MKQKKNILVTTYWSYNNALITTYTLPYVRIILKQLAPGCKIYLLTLSDKQNFDKTNFEKFRTELEKENIVVINYTYSPFGFGMAFRFTRIFLELIGLILTKNISGLHGWCTPGGAIACLLSIVTRKPLVLDSFEPHALNMIENGSWTKKSTAFNILFKLEKLQFRKATEVICAAKGMIEHAETTYGAKKKRYFVKPACVDLNLFFPPAQASSDAANKTITCLYAGKFGGIYLDKEVFDFFKVAIDYFGDRFKIVLLTSHSEAEIELFCKNSAVDRNKVQIAFVKHEEVPAYLRMADFGICPVKPVPTKAFCSPIKNGEYWASGMPVVITRNISDDSRLIAENEAGYVLQQLNEQEYLNAVKKIEYLLAEKNTSLRIRQLAEQYRNFEIAESIYKTIYA